MNIFILDHDLQKNAQYHVDKHVVKMCTEYAQILSTVVRFTGIDCGYKMTHVNHPSVKWARESLQNWLYLRELLICLNAEYVFRYSKNKDHKAYTVAMSLPIPELEDIGLTKIKLAMPEQYHHECPVTAYRNYYIGDKQHIAKWSNRPIPDWFQINNGM